MDKVSVVIPVYNAEKFIHRCIDSVLSQTYSNLELILINDGSRDNTLAILQEYAVGDARIKLVNQNNKGVSATRNVGLSHVTGDYIQFIDADDWIEPDMIAHMISLFQGENDVDIVFCRHDNTETTDQITSRPPESLERWDRDRQQLEFMQHKRMTGMLWNKMFRASLFQGLLFDEEVCYAEDAQMLWKLLKNSNTMVVTNVPLYHHVIEKTSISHQPYSATKYGGIRVWQEIIEDTRTNYQSLLVLAKERLAMEAISAYYFMSKSEKRTNCFCLSLIKIIKQEYFIIVTSKNIKLKRKLYASAIKAGLYR